MPETDDIDDLIAQLRDGEADEAAAQELADALRDRPEARDRYLRQMYLASLLHEARGAQPTAAVQKPSARRRVLLLVGAAAALLAGCIAFFALTGAQDPALVAKIEITDGSVLIDGKKAAVGAPIAPGQSLLIEGRASFAAIVYPDGTRVFITGSSELQLGKTEHKHLIVTSGVLHADVAKQPAGRPMEIVTPNSRLDILGTRFVVAAGEESTDLQVSEGRVRMTRNSGGSVEVSAGERARFSAAFGLEVSELLTPSDSWRRDFEDESETWGLGNPITEGLPKKSKRGMATVLRQLRYDGNHYYQTGIKDGIDGLCQITDTTHFHLTFRVVGEPQWFNVFVNTIGRNEAGKVEVRKFKLDNKHLKRPQDIKQAWHTFSIPLSAFEERSSRGEYGGPPPEPGHIIGTVYLSHPPPDRQLQIDAIGFTPDGSGEPVLTLIEQ